MAIELSVYRHFDIWTVSLFELPMDF